MPLESHISGLRNTFVICTLLGSAGAWGGGLIHHCVFAIAVHLTKLLRGLLMASGQPFSCLVAEMFMLLKTLSIKSTSMFGGRYVIGCTSHPRTGRMQADAAVCRLPLGEIRQASA